MKKLFHVIVLFCIHLHLFAQFDPAAYVNPLIGTQRMGHTFPGAVVPFGMVQLSPQTGYISMFEDGKYNADVYKYCSGYQYDDTLVYGFAHTAFSGTGHSDLGDLLIMPITGSLTLNPEEFSSSFLHKNETAMPGYYSTFLDKYEIKAELTTTERVGMHKYTFAHADRAFILLDMVYNIYNYDDKNVWTFLRVENDSTVTGYRQTHGWARTRTVYFAIRFSKPIANFGHKKYDAKSYNGFYRKFNEELNFPEMAGRNLRAWFGFGVQENESIMLKVALSSVSTQGALANMDAEMPDWNFEQVRASAYQKWNKELSKIVVEMLTPEDRTVFYTALYHSFISPSVYEDVDGKYMGLDQNVYTSDGFTNYTTFSLWDTYRALHPFFTIIQPARNNDMIKSMLAHQQQSVHGMLPIWSHYANENWCMIGYHSVSVIADAFAKNATDADIQTALNACVKTSNVGYFDGIGHYTRLGYVPEDLSGNSVSKTLEYAYDDWCIAQLALKAGADSVYKVYSQRALNYRNVFNSTSGYMQPKLADGSWRLTFDPYDTHGQGFIEGNALNYGLYVPQNVDDMISMMGGNKAFSKQLDYIFSMHLDDKYIEKNEDITRDGIIGAYVHGNEPGHHMAYLYNFTGDVHKTQARVRQIMRSMYASTPDGLCGNDDAGQMSAWYLFSAMGFYPVLPGSDRYELGSPLVKSAVIHLENGKTFTIKTKNQSEKNILVKKVILNGKELNRHYILHGEIINGGEIIFNY